MKKVKINDLNPHPLNRKIYGYDENIQELVEKIRTSNWVKPILINSNHTIISGHRRVEACKQLGISEIECEIVSDDPVIQLELLVSENHYRVKTNIQMIKEAEVYEEIETHKAYQRKIEVGKQNLGQSTDGVNWSQLGETGTTSKKVSKKVGMSETSYKRAKAVRKFEKEHPDLEWIFEETMNQSIDGAVQLTKKSPEFIELLIDKVSGNTELIIPTIRELEKEQSIQSLPTGKYGIILFDYTDRFTGNLLQTDISSICEDDCLLLMWVRPHQINNGLAISKNWGFRFCTSIIWNKSPDTPVTLDAEILLISVTGSPNVNFKRFDSNPIKPEIVEQMIRNEYQGWAMVEILL